MGGVGKNKKKLMQGKMPRKKVLVKKKAKKKIHAEERSNPRPCCINIDNKDI